MNPGNTTKQYEEFIFRRTTEPIPFFGFDLPGSLWVFVLGLVLLVGLVYVGVMYLRDSKGVGILWAGLLGLLRIGVYAAVAFIFLLPSRQTWEESTTTSKVAVLFDVSQSMVVTKDEVPKEGQDPNKIPTRQDLVLKFLTSADVDFLGRLQKKNPTTVYRFARGLDGDPLYLADGLALTSAEKTLRDNRLKQGGETDDLPEPQVLPPQFWAHWLKPAAAADAKVPATPDDLNGQDQKRWEQENAKRKTLADNRFFSDTNLGDAVLGALNREGNNMVQGIVIFTDGRSTEGSGAAFEEIKKRARAATPPIPIFVVGIGQERLQTRIEITDLRAPIAVQPEDKFKVVMEVIGEGLAEQEFAAGIELTFVKKETRQEKDKDGKTVDVTVEVPQEIYVIEQEDKPAVKKDGKPDDKKDPKPEPKPGDKPEPSKPREKISLGESILLRPDKPPKFDKGTPPRVELEFTLDAAALAKQARNIDLVNDPKYKGKKWEICQTGDDGEFHFQGRVPKEPHEAFAEDEHKTDKVGMRVKKRPVHVLLFASAATHDFQFLNAMMLREKDKQLAELSVYIQPPAGKDPLEWIQSVVFGVDKEHLLSKFPDKYDAPGTPGAKAADKVYDLKEYDVIVAFDPDWGKLSAEQLQLLDKWVQKGGGLIVLGGPINTIQLARPGPNFDKLKPVREMLPVVLKDVRIEALDRTTEAPWPLNFPGATPEMEFLRLSEDPKVQFLDDWKEFFHGKDKAGPVKRGFFNYYPAESVRTGGIVAATFMDPRAKMKNGEQMPWIVLSDPAGGRRVVWLAWGETRRLRQDKEEYFERFWTKLIRYAGAANQTNQATRIKIDMGRSFPAGKFVQVGAEISGPNGDPLVTSRDSELPVVTLKLPAGVSPDIKTEYKMTQRKIKDDNDKGKFSLRFQVKSPGEYQLELKVPGTGDSKPQKFLVKEANPELDNTRPDFQAMYDLASDADEVVFGRMQEADRQLLKARLAASAPKFKDDKDTPEGKSAAAKDGKLRLYFDLESARLIPDCMVTRVDTKQNKGKYEDVWDGEWDVHGVFAKLMIPAWLRNGLAVIVGLLSVEWLIRKLLRLA